MLNTPGDTSLDEVLTTLGLTGTSVLVLSLDGKPGSHELTYGLVLDTVGPGAVNLSVITSLVVTTSKHLSDESDVVVDTENVANVVSENACIFDTHKDGPRKALILGTGDEATKCSQQKVEHRPGGLAPMELSPNPRIKIEPTAPRPKHYKASANTQRHRIRPA